MSVSRGRPLRPGPARGFHAWPVSLVPVEPVDEQDTVEMICLVGQAARQALRALDTDGLTYMSEPSATTRRDRANSYSSPGMERQPSISVTSSGDCSTRTGLNNVPHRAISRISVSNTT